MFTQQYPVRLFLMKMCLHLFVLIAIMSRRCFLCVARALELGSLWRCWEACLLLDCWNHRNTLLLGHFNVNSFKNALHDSGSKLFQLTLCVFSWDFILMRFLTSVMMSYLANGKIVNEQEQLIELLLHEKSPQISDELKRKHCVRREQARKIDGGKLNHLFPRSSWEMWDHGRIW